MTFSEKYENIRKQLIELHADIGSDVMKLEMLNYQKRRILHFNRQLFHMLQGEFEYETDNTSEMKYSCKILDSIKKENENA